MEKLVLNYLKYEELEDETSEVETAAPELEKNCCSTEMEGLNKTYATIFNANGEKFTIPAEQYDRYVQSGNLENPSKEQFAANISQSDSEHLMKLSRRSGNNIATQLYYDFIGDMKQATTNSLAQHESEQNEKISSDKLFSQSENKCEIHFYDDTQEIVKIEDEFEETMPQTTEYKLKLHNNKNKTIEFKDVPQFVYDERRKNVQNQIEQAKNIVGELNKKSEEKSTTFSKHFHDVKQRNVDIAILEAFSKCLPQAVSTGHHQNLLENIKENLELDNNNQAEAFSKCLPQPVTFGQHQNLHESIKEHHNKQPLVMPEFMLQSTLNEKDYLKNRKLPTNTKTTSQQNIQREIDQLSDIELKKQTSKEIALSDNTTAQQSFPEIIDQLLDTELKKQTSQATTIHMNLYDEITKKMPDIELKKQTSNEIALSDNTTAQQSFPEIIDTELKKQASQATTDHMNLYDEIKKKVNTEVVEAITKFVLQHINNDDKRNIPNDIKDNADIVEVKEQAKEKCAPQHLNEELAKGLNVKIEQNSNELKNEALQSNLKTSQCDNKTAAAANIAAFKRNFRNKFVSNSIKTSRFHKTTSRRTMPAQKRNVADFIKEVFDDQSISQTNMKTHAIDNNSKVNGFNTGMLPQKKKSTASKLVRLKMYKSLSALENFISFRPTLNDIVGLCLIFGLCLKTYCEFNGISISEYLCIISKLFCNMLYSMQH